MANNDRVTRDPSPSWIGDNKSNGKLLATKTTNGTIGWNDEEKTKNLLSRDAFNKPGWRDKIVIPEGMAVIDFDVSLFQVLLEGTGANVNSGDLVPLGGVINIILLPQSYEYGCKMEMVNGAVSSSHFMKNFSTASDTLPNLVTTQVIGNIQIVGTSRKRSYVRMGCQVLNTVTATLEVNSWGDKGHQTKTMNLVNSWGEPTGMELYAGDEVQFHFEVTSPYHWANFVSGNNPEALYPVNKSEIVYTTNGGNYNVTLTEATLYMDMSAVRPVKFYLYQPTSNNFNNITVRVDRLNTNLNIYKNTNQPTVGTVINYGKNGVAGNHVDLYPGMELWIHPGYGSVYVSAYISMSVTTTTPALPALPSNKQEAFAYLSPCVVTIPQEANQNGYFAVGLRYVKDNFKGSEVYIQGATTSLSNGSSIYFGSPFKPMMDAIYTNNYNFFTDHLINASRIKAVSSTTKAERLALRNGMQFSWLFRLDGDWQRSDKYVMESGEMYDGYEPVGQVYQCDFGPFAATIHCYVESVNITSTSDGFEQAVVTCRADSMYVGVAAPVADWYPPGDNTRYIPLSTLKQDWGDKPWYINTNWWIDPYFVAIVREV